MAERANAREALEIKGGSHVVFIKIAPEDCRLEAADEWRGGARRTRTFGLGTTKAAPNVRTDLLFLWACAIIKLCTKPTNTVSI
jgi:hypothetical protein